MKDTENSMLRQRRELLVGCLILLVWSIWLAFLAEVRIPVFVKFAGDFIYGKSWPGPSDVLIRYLRWWKFIPAVILGLIAALIVVRRRSRVLRILCASTVLLLILACTTMTVVVTEGILCGIELFLEQGAGTVGAGPENRLSRIDRDERNRPVDSLDPFATTD
ncbi:MAG: hypothetical protein HN919_06615 [Verrucomicrobia bacterium]|jgi:hypothetical protein|nr:hypothetical protein [Verrucomicrobiota bacterium]